MYSKSIFFFLSIILTPLAFAADPINLGTAGNYVILTKTGVSCVPACVITGDVGVSPIDATALTGFSLTADATNLFSTSPLVTGKLYAANYAAPTPTILTTAISNMETAYTDAAGRTPDYTELHTGDLSGKTLQPGVYKWGTGVSINTDMTLDGDGVFIFQIAQGITQANNTQIILTGGAQAKNIFWQAAETVSIGTGAHFEGIILAKLNVSVGTNASINGRLLAQTAVTLIQTTVGISDAQNIISGAQITRNINALEGGTNGNYTIVLSSQPTGNVEITATADAQTQVSHNGTIFGSVAVFTFTSSNWNMPQTVTVKAIDDTVVEGNHTGTLTHAITGTINDTNYPISLILNKMTANITDNDSTSSLKTIKVIFSLSGSGQVTTEPAGIDCQKTTGICQATFPVNSTITLIAIPNENSEFRGFGGDTDCSNEVLTLTDNRQCIAFFEQKMIPPVVVIPPVVDGNNDGNSDTTSALVPVYRLWSHTWQNYFYTNDVAERGQMLSQQQEWRDEGIAYYIYATTDHPINSRPIYRFWSNTWESYFYTIYQQEMEYLVTNFPDQWQYRGVAYYAYAEGEQATNTMPIYRFYSFGFQSHFYTSNEDEKNLLLTQPATEWRYEGVAWYVSK